MHDRGSETRPAALFRMEGVLVRRPTLTAAAWLSTSAAHVRARLAGLGALALAGPLTFGPLRDPLKARRLAWAALEGMSEDRLVVLGRLYAERFVVPALEPVGLRLLEACRARGQRLVLLSDNLDVIVRPVAEHLGVDDVLCNVMEVEDLRATGRLRPPFIGPEIAGEPLRELAARASLDLAGARGYGASAADSLLLGSVGLPCAVDPDRELRRIARDLDWPVVDA